jgi:hypothetical protein
MDKVILQIQSVLKTTPERWQRLVQTLPDDLLHRRPEPEEWSAVECLSHIVDTEGVFQYRIRCFLAGEDFSSFDPDTEGSAIAEMPVKDLVEKLSTMRQESLKALETLSEPDLDRQARHAELGMVSLRQMLNNWAAHDLMHTVQAERALMQPFIDQCGPWQKFYSDHWVAAQK